eukprot:CAMPEP_0204627950 /NCGR_PEP_ID=MMETSP0717-20131115/14598_1 /ASSEMBLY_ACC=CAM_ASM_000666 /TAXON_ID=230516 /ORGANISM="Chaetoceros curvisetus" /LENGTH=41 /DNA_ID= /DNA_START= /DNA_END= /DNA_ORIENTATION=
MNPHVDSEAILAYFNANMNVVFENDNRGKSPWDYLREYNNE